VTLQRRDEPTAADAGAAAGTTSAGGGIPYQWIGAAAQAVYRALNPVSRRAILRDIQAKYGIDSPQYRAAAAKYPRAAAARETVQMRALGKGKITRAQRGELKRLLKTVPEYKGMSAAERRAILTGRALRPLEPLLRAAATQPWLLGILGVLYPSAITPEVPIPQRTGPGGPPPQPPPQRPPWQDRYNPPDDRAPPPPAPWLLPRPPYTIPEVDPNYDWIEIEGDTKRAIERPPPLELPPAARVPEQTVGGTVSDWLLRNRNLLSPFLLPLLLPSGRSRLRDPLSQVSPPGTDPLTYYRTPGVPYLETGSGYSGLTGSLEDTCRQLRKQKRKPKKRRNVCYRGTYTETQTGLQKRKKERIPCTPARKK